MSVQVDAVHEAGRFFAKVAAAMPEPARSEFGEMGEALQWLDDAKISAVAADRTQLADKPVATNEFYGRICGAMSNALAKAAAGQDPNGANERNPMIDAIKGSGLEAEALTTSATLRALATEFLRESNP